MITKKLQKVLTRVTSARENLIRDRRAINTASVHTFRQALEIGRACIAREHRNSKVLYLLFKALLKFLKQSNKRYFFGCCSIFTQNYSVGAEIFRQFEREKHIHPTLFVRPRSECAFSMRENAGEICETELKLPALFKIYLKMGAKICGEPAIDRKFRTIDFFVIFDLAAMPKKESKKSFARSNKSRQTRTGSYR